MEQPVSDYRRVQSNGVCRQIFAASEEIPRVAEKTSYVERFHSSVSLSAPLALPCRCVCVPWPTMREAQLSKHQTRESYFRGSLTWLPLTGRDHRGKQCKQQWVRAAAG